MGAVCCVSIPSVQLCRRRVKIRVSSVAVAALPAPEAFKLVRPSLWHCSARLHPSPRSLEHRHAFVALPRRLSTACGVSSLASSEVCVIAEAFTRALSLARLVTLVSACSSRARSIAGRVQETSEFPLSCLRIESGVCSGGKKIVWPSFLDDFVLGELAAVPREHGVRVSKTLGGPGTGPSSTARWKRLRALVSALLHAAWRTAEWPRLDQAAARCERRLCRRCRHATELPASRADQAAAMRSAVLGRCCRLWWPIRPVPGVAPIVGGRRPSGTTWGSAPIGRFCGVRGGFRWGRLPVAAA